MRYTGLYVIVVSCLYACTHQDRNEEPSSRANLLFTLVSQDESHIDFINKVEDGEAFNILTYRNFYNGGGVALGDINNDGLIDIFFISNMEQNKLYLNKGNFLFEDISEKVGIGGKHEWSTGATMVDVNGDGWLDIYVCNSGDVQGDNRENELYINNHDLTFTESGKEFNLNNQGFTTHASFFDYDADGDLDCYILNNSFIDPGKISLYKNLREEVDGMGGDKLYRNDEGRFTDVTIDAGIYSSKIGFGLGVSVSDLNNDNLPDIYLSNDFWERDYLYVNQGNGKFSEQLTDLLTICSISSMGADIADINNDGLPEIFSTDMLPADNYRIKAMTIFDGFQLEGIKYRASYHYQILQNCLHLNNGNLDFQEVASFSGVAATDWSWGALIFDFQNDGLNDIFVSNGIQRDIMYVDFTDFVSDKEKVKKIVVEKGRFDWRDFIPHIPSNPLPNYGFVNKGNLVFDNEAFELGLGTPSFSNGAAYGDLDNDGDMDLVVNNVNSPAFIFQNMTDSLAFNHFLKVRFKGPNGNTFGVGAKVNLYLGGQVRVLQNFPSRGFQSSVAPELIFGLGQYSIIDSLMVVWPDMKQEVIQNLDADQSIELNYTNAITIHKQEAVRRTQIFKNASSELRIERAVHKENLYNDFNYEPLSIRMFSTEGPKILAGDVNNDKREDFVLLGAKGDQDKLFVQQGNGTFKFESSVFAADSLYESTCGTFIDLNNDGYHDLVIGSGGNERNLDQRYFQLRVYINDTKGGFRRVAMDNLSSAVGNFSCIIAGDYDNDGFTDLFIGSRLVPGNYGLIPRSYLLKNDGGNLRNVTPSTIGGAGMVTDAAWTDLDGDDDLDLVIVGDWMPVTIYYNEKGVFSKSDAVPNSEGWWNTIEAADLDQDGDQDFVLGNWGLNTRFMASVNRPLTMYVKDFDSNGKSEPIINWYPPDDEVTYPFATKMEMMQQIPFLKKENLTYEAYSHRTYGTLFTNEMRKDALHYKTFVLESSILWNNKDKFSLQPLPAEAQIAPIFTIAVFDFDADGMNDIWLGGNFCGLKPQVGRYNSTKSVYLKNTGNRTFDYVSPANTGISVAGEIRDSKVITVRGKKMILIARNNDTSQAFSFSNK